MANLKQIEKYLKSKKIPYKVIDLGDQVFTVKGVVETGVDEDEIIKTLIVGVPNFHIGFESGRHKIKRSFKNVQFVALAVRGKDRVDFKKVRKLFGNKSELAKPDEVLKVAGVSVGAVCPILLEIPVCFDRKVMGLKRVNMGSGDLRCGLEMKLFDLLRAVGTYEVEDLIKISTQIRL